ncbi:hypothetical protein SLEP1_g59991 [Rubroshorea leprosula]|uniref:Secreted protein n=1 Tax=Rubroshorea leprosula TaxID=152421 RepID=A0AAV5MV67_9ROSI|nr:hypothetical protein SLEP1_g59991 [Rubroshorea leprosula]
MTVGVFLWLFFWSLPSLPSATTDRTDSLTNCLKSATTSKLMSSEAPGGNRFQYLTSLSEILFA